MPGVALARGGLLLCASAASVAGCVTSLYPGPNRPDNETIVVETEGTTIVSIDDVEPATGSKFRILPGAHHIEVALDDRAMGGRRSSVLTLPVCFTGRPGRTYLIQPTYSGRTWRPRVIDESVTTPIASDDCSRRARRPIARAPAAAAPSPPSSTLPPAVASPDAGAEDEASTATASTPDATSATPAPPESGERASAPPAPPAGPTSDAEIPRASVRAEPPVVRPFKPAFDIGAEIGLFQGGEELATATNSNGYGSTLGVGDGLLLALSTRATPLWLSDSVGLGIGVGGGLKYWSVGGDGAQASMFKYLLTGSGHLLIAVDPVWLIFVQGGIEKDYGMDFAINGQGTGVPFRSRIGFVGELGAQHALDDFWSFAFSLRATILDYEVQDITVGANSVGLTFSIHCAR